MGIYGILCAIDSKGDGVSWHQRPEVGAHERVVSSPSCDAYYYNVIFCLYDSCMASFCLLLVHCSFHFYCLLTVAQYLFCLSFLVYFHIVYFTVHGAFSLSG